MPWITKNHLKLITPRHIILRPQGQLGNNLFQYAFARNIGLQNDVNVILEDPAFCKSDLEFLGLTTKCERLPYLYQILHHHRNWLDKSLNLIIRNSPFGYKSIKQQDNDPILLSKTFKNISIHGRLQDYRYWKRNDSQILNEIRDAILKKSNLNYLKVNDVLGVHVRRGDYLKPEFANSIGVLSEKYFIRAIECVLNTQKVKKIIIFTDQPEHEHILEIRNKFKVEIRSNPNKYDDLVEMMCCSHIIISNSTFSWWAAALGFGFNSNRVWAPSSFKRRNSQDIEAHVPHSWNLFPVDWVNSSL